MPIYLVKETRKGGYKDYGYMWDMLQFFKNNDIKKFIIAAEKGEFGHRHWQMRMDTRWDFKTMKEIFPKAHIEESNAEWNDKYERKEGKFIAWDDNDRQWSERFGICEPWQEETIEALKGTTDRTILYIYNPEGNIGKSWLTGHLYETGQAFPVPATIDTVKGIIQFIANGYNNEPFIILDIPKTLKFDKKLATAVESIKSGIIYDTRYKTTIRNINPKVLIFSNQKPNRKLLSYDRWIILKPEVRFTEYGDGFSRHLQRWEEL